MRGIYLNDPEFIGTLENWTAGGAQPQYVGIGAAPDYQIVATPAADGTRDRDHQEKVTGRSSVTCVPW